MDIRSERTRKMLVDAFEELQATRPFEEITVSELCERSTVRRATFYRHFEDKYAFYEYYLNTVTDRFLSEIATEWDDVTELQTYVEGMHEQLIDFAEAHPDMMKQTLGHKTSANILDMVIRHAAEGIAQRLDAQDDAGETRSSASSELLSILYSSAMVHGLRWWYFEGKPIPKEDLIRRTTDMLLRSVNQ